jgi:hypothetical protein
MDLSGHGAFRTAASQPETVRQVPAPFHTGRQLLIAAFAALASPATESVVLHLRSGLIIEGVLDIRLDGLLAWAATHRGQFTHLFPIEDVVLLRRVPRGRGR